MRFAAVVALVLISGSPALAQKMKDTVPPVYHPPATVHHGAAAPPLVAPSSASSAAQLAQIEAQSARVRSNKPAARQPAGNVKTDPASDLGKNKPVRAGRSPQPTNPNNH